MPKIQTHRQTDSEKKFKILRQQLYGGSDKAAKLSSGSAALETADTSTLRHADSKSSPTETPRSDVTFLRHDLLKISILSFLALGAQVLLFLSLKFHYLRLPI